MAFTPSPKSRSKSISAYDLGIGGREGGGDGSSEMGKFIIYGSRFSYFTQKLVAAAQWYSTEPVVSTVKTPAVGDELRERSGTHQIPVVKTSEGFVLADTTPIMRVYLDGKLGLSRGPRLYGRKHETPGITRAVIALMEEYFDEWIPRLAVHFRWNRTESSDVSAPKMIEELLGFPREKDPVLFDGELLKLKTWGPKSCRATGISSPVQQAKGEEECARIFSRFEEHLAKGRGPFLFGRVPCAVDASLYGGLYAHFLHDEYPKNRIFNSLPRVTHWVDDALTAFSVRRNRGLDVMLPNSDFNAGPLPEFADFMLSEMKKGFVGFVMGNREALGRGAKSYVVKVYGEEVSYLTREYVEHSRRMLLRFILEECLLSARETAEFKELLARYELVSLFPELDGRSAVVGKL